MIEIIRVHSTITNIFPFLFWTSFQKWVEISRNSFQPNNQQFWNPLLLGFCHFTETF